jgi:predicted O-methyltransferase YrrM
MNHFKSAIRFFRYYLTAGSKFAVHPPFVYHLYTEVILDKKFKQDYLIPEKIRKEMLGRKETIEVKDLGAGSEGKRSRIRMLNTIAARSAKSPKYAQLIFRLAKHLQPSSIIELGTSLGITASYLAKAIPENLLITIEGCEQTAKVAKENFVNHKITNIEVVNDNFENALPAVLKRTAGADLVFFDGNHKKTPTLSYFEQCLQYVHNDSLFIFDDIHWSEEMEDAWKIIKQNEKVTLSIDLFSLGLAFFKKELSKQDFVLRF